LTSYPGLERQDVDGVGEFTGTGVRIVPIAHVGNTNGSPEEAGAVRLIVEALASGDCTWTDMHGEVRPLTLRDLVVITPYSAHVAALERALPNGSRIGTVDKFQGQQAPVSIYSMATSSPADAPRGMEFLYSLNRLNVATSRARCLAIVVASPELLRVHCSTPPQMQLANALTRLVELAEHPYGDPSSVIPSA
jgi:hypothetical protein